LEGDRGDKIPEIYNMPHPFEVYRKKLEEKENMNRSVQNVKEVEPESKS
jgi:hypothetical protein